MLFFTLYVLCPPKKDAFEHLLVQGATKIMLYFQKKKLLEKYFRNNERFIFV